MKTEVLNLFLSELAAAASHLSVSEEQAVFQ
jgi:hypothetical protein